MTNLIKSDLYRLKKNKVFRNSISCIMLTIIFITMFFADKEASIGIISGYTEEKMYGFYLNATSVRLNDIGIIMNSLGLTIIICIMLVIIVGDLVRERYEFGVLKNTISYGHNRYKVYISNLICTFVGIISLSLFTIATSYIIWKIIYGQGMTITYSEAIIIIKMVLVQLIILCSMCSIYTMLFTLIGKKDVVAACAMLFFTFIAISLIELNNVYINSKVPILMLMDICSSIANNKTLLTFSINSIIIILISTTIGCIIFNKQDIK